MKIGKNGEKWCKVVNSDTSLEKWKIVLIGQYATKLSDKSRTALPARFRRELKSKVIIAKWYEGCLVIVAQDKWRALLERLTSKLEFVTKSVRDTDRFILGSAFDIDLDAQGRFIIPKNLKDFAHLGSELVVLGLGDRVEVWDRSRWEKREAYISQHASSLVEELANENKDK